MRRPGEARGPGSVAVVIPTRDRWPLLRTAVASALAQEDVDAQVVVVDDGSVDETARELEAVSDPRLLVLHHDRPRGVSAARNLGLSRVTATWVAFLDDDDVWAPRYLASMLDAARVSELDAERVGLVYSGQLLLALTRAGVSREQAYEWVQRNAMKTWDEGGEFQTHVLADPDISRLLAAEEVARVLSPEPYLRNVGRVFARVFGRAEG